MYKNKQFQTPVSINQSANISTAFSSPYQPGIMPERDQTLRRNRSEGPFANRFYQANPFTKRNFSVRTDSSGVSACFGVSNPATKLAPADHPHIRAKTAQEQVLNTTAPPEVAHIHDRKEAKKIQRYTNTFGSTIFAPYNSSSPGLTSKRIQNELLLSYQDHDQAVHEKSELEEQETPKRSLTKQELQNAFETPVKEFPFEQKPKTASSEISKEILKLIEKRNMDRSSHKNSYYEELKAQAEQKQALRKLEKEAERQEAQKSLGLNYECYRRDQFIAEERAKLNPTLKDQMLEKTKKKMDEKHEQIREKLKQDEAIRMQNNYLKEIISKKPQESTMKQAMSKIKAAEASQDDLVKAQDHSMELVLRDGLITKEKQKLMSSYLLKQMQQSRKGAKQEKKKYAQWHN